MTVVLACSLGVVSIALGGVLLAFGHQRSMLLESERRSRLGAEHARLHLSVLAKAGDQLSVALDSYEEALTRLGDSLVPDFADWFSVDLVQEDGELHRVAAELSGDRSVKLSSDGPHVHPEGAELVARVIESGRDEILLSELASDGHPGSLAAPGVGVSAGRASGVESMMIVPVHVRGLSFGALTFVTTPGRRGYRRSDLETAHGVANRVAAAVERVLLWRDSRLAEQAAVRRAEQLHRLVGAALSVNAALSELDILAVVAQQAKKVFSAERATVCTTHGDSITTLSSEGVPGEASPRAAAACRLALELGRPLRSSGGKVEGLPEDLSLDPALLPDGSTASWIAVPLGGGTEDVERLLLVEGGDSDPFGAEDESLLLLLAQMTSVASVNARLYQEVRGSERRLRAVVESSPLAIAELAPDGEVRWWNSAAEALFARFDTIPGDTSVPLDAESEQAWEEILEKSRHALASVGTDIRVRGPHGTNIELSVSSAPLLEPTGEVSGVVVVSEDVTDRRRVLAQIQQSERLAAMARLAGGLAHDFNNLVTVILGSSELLARHEELEGSLLEEVSSIQRAGMRAAALTAQLLAVGRDRSRDPVALDPDVVLSSIRPLIRRVLGDAIELEIERSASRPLILVDRGDLERAVLNLAINARDAMPEGGRFALRTDVVSSPERVCVSATDTGYGMDEETARQCFDPFYSTKEQGGGTGLGLFAVQALVTQAGGQVTVTTAPGAGTTFTMWFPKLDDDHDANARPGDSPKSRTSTDAPKIAFQ